MLRHDIHNFSKTAVFYIKVIIIYSFSNTRHIINDPRDKTPMVQVYCIDASKNRLFCNSHHSDRFPKERESNSRFDWQ